MGKIGFIGGGIMAEALISGILNSNSYKPDEINVSDPVKTRIDELEQNYGITCFINNLKIIESVDIIIIAVKPQHIETVLEEIKTFGKSSQIVISIVAGANLNLLSSRIGHSNVVRVMPNTPAQTSDGMIVWTADKGVSEKNYPIISNILKSLGKEIYFEDEKYIDMATAVSASGPAYIAIVIESLIDAGVYIGLQREISKSLVMETFKGSLAYLDKTNIHPAKLRESVSSPGGGTVEAIKSLEENDIRAAFYKAIKAAYNKYQMLGEMQNK